MSLEALSNSNHKLTVYGTLGTFEEKRVYLLIEARHEIILCMYIPKQCKH
jgi:hypothetical protein